MGQKGIKKKSPWAPSDTSRLPDPASTPTLPLLVSTSAELVVELCDCLRCPEHVRQRAVVRRRVQRQVCQASVKCLALDGILRDEGLLRVRWREPIRRRRRQVEVVVWSVCVSNWYGRGGTSDRPARKNKMHETKAFSFPRMTTQAPRLTLEHEILYC